MKPFEIFTIAGICLTISLGIFNLVINIRNQRKNQRDNIYNRQFDFFTELQKEMSSFEDAFFDLNQSYSNQNELQDLIHKHSNQIDFIITKNEIIIPDELYNFLNDFSKHCHNLSSLSYSEPEAITKEKKTEFLSKAVDLTEEIRDFLGIEKLSAENKQSAYSRI